jgi:Tfp pilus assembly protein PilV
MRRRSSVGRSFNIREDGFTIVELLLASTILVVALLGIASVLPTADMTTHQSGQTTKAISLAQEMVEAIKNDPYNDLNLYSGVNTNDITTFPADNPPTFLGNTRLTKWKNDINLILLTGAGITNGFGTITVSTVTSNPGGAPILRKVTVTVNWTERSQSRTVTLATLASGV